MLATLKGLSVSYKPSRLYLNSPVGLTGASSRGKSLTLVSLNKTLPFVLC